MSNTDTSPTPDQAKAIAVLLKLWSGWIATGQLRFTVEDMRTANDLVGAAGLEPLPVDLVVGVEKHWRVGNAIRLIAAERLRQVDSEGWTTAHDDGHFLGELATAAACYAMPPDQRVIGGAVHLVSSRNGLPRPDAWPWDKWWKPTPDNRIRELVKAGALIAAEIDRVQRAEWRKDSHQKHLARKSRPEMVCLCGSTRFGEAFDRANYEHTLAGRIVLSIGCVTHSDSDLGITPDQKAELDELHKRKIDMADWVMVLNVGGYIGESTRGEIEYAQGLGKRIEYLEPLAGKAVTSGE